MNFRTDLALERREYIDKHSPDGIISHQKNVNGITVDTITVINEQGEKVLGKPKGTYITVETVPFTKNSDILSPSLYVLRDELISLLPDEKGCVLVAGLGNEDITPDALGPRCISMLFAEILHSWGYTITGSDNNTGDNIIKLRSLGIDVILGQKAENITGAEMIVYTAAILQDNPELVAAKESGIPCFERSKIFGALTRRYSNCISVCGTHGKTTVTAMLTQVLTMADKDPSALIGGRLPLIDSHARVGKNETFVCEACEYCDHYHDLSPMLRLFSM